MVKGFNFLRENLLKNKILIENFTFLSVLQISNLILFLITIPFLFRVLGSDLYGLIVFAQAIVFYFSVFINFGFNLTATRDISVNRADRFKVSEIVSSVLTLKILLFLFSMGVMVSLTLLIPEFIKHRTLFILAMLAGLSEALFPVWYFQGIEKMKYITFINVTTRIIATVFVFILIDSPGDYVYYPLVIGLGTVTGAIAALAVVFYKHGIEFRLVKPGLLREYFRENLTYFLSNVSTQIYANANKVIIGALIGLSHLAYYDIADKVVYILRVPYSLIGQTLLPRMSRNKNVSFLNRLIILTLVLTLFLLVAVMIFSDLIVRYFSGNNNPEAANILRILSVALLPMIISLFYGDILLITLSRKIEYLKTRFFGMLFYFVLISILFISGFLDVITAAITLVLLEFFIATLSYIFAARHDTAVNGEDSIMRIIFPNFGSK
ncbi:MAG: oligosaccharide flippase family protein [Bacteroidales bacterium]